jgi:hypothetical protein
MVAENGFYGGWIFMVAEFLWWLNFYCGWIFMVAENGFYGGWEFLSHVKYFELSVSGGKGGRPCLRCGETHEMCAIRGWWFWPIPRDGDGVDVNPWHLAMISIAQLQVLSLSTGTSEGFESFSISWTSHLHASGRSTNTLW